MPILEKHKNESICFKTAIDEIEQNFDAVTYLSHYPDSKEEVISKMRSLIKELELNGRLDRDKEKLRFSILKNANKNQNPHEQPQKPSPLFVITPF